MLTHCGRGAKAIVGGESHTYVYEAGGASALGGVVLAPIKNNADGTLDLDALRAEASPPHDDHFAQAALVTIENTHNRCGGAAVALSHMAEVAEIAHSRGLKVHLDGARIFNAALALESSAREIAAHADSVSFCLSKGLACPVGTILCGTREFVAGAHRIRKMLGGGMRQAGIIAAAGIVALETMVDRMAEDHANARALAQGMGLIAGLNVWPCARRTNMIVFDIEGGAKPAAQFAAYMKNEGVLLSQRDATSFRCVTHYGITRADIDRTVAIAAQAAGEAFGDTQ